MTAATPVNEDANVEAEAPETTEADTKAADRKPVDPFEKAPSEAQVSLAKYVTDNSPVELTAEQAQAVLVLHGQWQSSPERKAEREAEKAAKAEAAAKAKEERERKAAEKAEAKAKADAEKKAKDAAKAAESAGDDSDLDTTDNSDEAAPETDGEAKPPRRRRKAAPANAEV